MRTRSIIASSTAALLSLSMAGTAFAYSYPDTMTSTERQSRRHVMVMGKIRSTFSSRHLDGSTAEEYSALRSESVRDMTGRADLIGRVNRSSLRNVNRHKLGMSRDGYRILNTSGDMRRRPGLQALRSLMHDPDAFLPPTLVTTGKAEENNYNRPTRRSIRGDRNKDFIMRR